MRYGGFRVFGWAVLVLVWSGAASAAPLANPGFEEPITFEGQVFFGSWEGFSGAPGASATNSSASPRSGAQHLALAINNTDNTFTGVFQDVPVTPGELVTLGGWLRSPSAPFDATFEARIEWRNATQEVARSPNLIVTPTDVYTPFELTEGTPPGAITARLVMAIQTFTGGPSNNGTVFVDDMLVPEPASGLTVLAVGMLLGMRGRRRSL